MFRCFELEKQADALIKRLDHIDKRKRQDIDVFAKDALDITLGRGPKGRVPSDLSVWVDRVEQQLRAENAFPAGVRVGTFRNSALILIDQWRRGLRVTVPCTSNSLNEWIREMIGNPDISDDHVEELMGFRIARLASLLAELFRHDPVSFFRLISFEFAAGGINDTIRYPALPFKREIRRPFHNALPLERIMRAIAEWRRIVQMVDELEAAAALDHLLMAAFTANGPNRADDVGYGPYMRIVGSMPLPVPMLKGIINDPLNPVPAMLSEFSRVLDPSNQLGASKRRPLFHFYGLDALDALLLGLLEIVCFARGVPCATVPKRETPINLGDAKLFDFAAAYASRWPTLFANESIDRALRARKMRTLYNNTAGILGSAYRFDPDCWLEPEQDASTFQHLHGVVGSKHDHGFYSAVGMVRDCLHGIFGVSQSHGDIGFQARVVAHLMTGTTVYTRDPTLILFQEHATQRSGFARNRSIARAQARLERDRRIQNPYHELPHALKPWGCAIDPADIRGRHFPMVPRKGDKAPPFSLNGNDR